MLCPVNKTSYFLSERNPSITSSTQKVVLKAGQGLNEWCRAYSHSEPEITWYLDDQQVLDRYGYTITSSLLSDAKQSTLKADSMNVRKSGQYKCVACNIGNCTSEVIRVYIEGEYWELALVLSCYSPVYGVLGGILTRRSHFLCSL